MTGPCVAILVEAALAVARAFAIAAASALSLLQTRKLLMAGTVSAKNSVLKNEEQREENKKATKQPLTLRVPTIHQSMPTCDANYANLMGKHQRQTAANGAQTLPTASNMPTSLAGKLLGVRPLTERVPGHTGKATRAH